jgi:hypothetical protein
MNRRLRRALIGGAAGLATLLAATTATSTIAAGASRSKPKPSEVSRVLLISVDGLHASDLAQWISEHPTSRLAQLAGDGTTYQHATTSMPSDSFPGLLAPVTGGTPKSTGVFYDDSYSRTMWAPGSDCTGPAGAEMIYDESIDTGVTTMQRPIMHATIDPTQLPEAMVGGTCMAVYPNDFLKTNTIFSVAHAAGKLTAWADKHPAYLLVAGHGTPNAVDDLFNTEINADLIPASLVDTRGVTITFPHPNPTGTGAYFIPDYPGDTEAYDSIKVDAVLNQIDGLTSGGQPASGVPSIFGMNFQTVSVAEKDVDPSKTCDPTRNDGTPCDPSYVPGAYEPGSLAFTPQMEQGMQYVDDQIGRLVDELRAKGLYDSTQIILTAKHGQSPIDPSKLALIGHAEKTVLASAGIATAQVTDDDVSLIWLANQKDADAAIRAFKDSIKHGNPARIQTIYSGGALKHLFGDPATNDRTPDLILQPIPGTIYSTSTAKVAEHGGFSDDDRDVALVVVHGGHDARPGRVFSGAVDTTQIAPTILDTLGLDPNLLDAVRAEHTHALPGS